MTEAATPTVPSAVDALRIQSCERPRLSSTDSMRPERKVNGTCQQRYNLAAISRKDADPDTDPSSIEGQPAHFFLGHISPISARFFAIFSLFAPS